MLLSSLPLIKQIDKYIIHIYIFSQISPPRSLKYHINLCINNIQRKQQHKRKPAGPFYTHSLFLFIYKYWLLNIKSKPLQYILPHHHAYFEIKKKPSNFKENLPPYNNDTLSQACKIKCNVIDAHHIHKTPSNTYIFITTKSFSSIFEGF